MRLSISGTYSSGKTSTVIALSHYTGVPRTLASTIRELLPAAVPGKKLAELTPAEYLQIAMERHTSRAVAEAALGSDFVSDGSSLQEWIYAAARVRYGMDPSATAQLEPLDHDLLAPEMLFFEQVVDRYGHSFRLHVRRTFDAFVHLENEHALTDDGHRPMNEGFRTFCDQALARTVAELKVPCWTIQGSLPERLLKIVDVFNMPIVMTVDDAVRRMEEDYAAIDKRLESERQIAGRL